MRSDDDISDHEHEENKVGPGGEGEEPKLAVKWNRMNPKNRHPRVGNCREHDGVPHPHGIAVGKNEFGLLRQGNVLLRLRIALLKDLELRSSLPQRNDLDEVLKVDFDFVLIVDGFGPSPLDHTALLQRSLRH